MSTKELENFDADFDFNLENEKPSFAAEGNIDDDFEFGDDESFRLDLKNLANASATNKMAKNVVKKGNMNFIPYQPLPVAKTAVMTPQAVIKNLSIAAENGSPKSRKEPQNPSTSILSNSPKLKKSSSGTSSPKSRKDGQGKESEKFNPEKLFIVPTTSPTGIINNTPPLASPIDKQATNVQGKTMIPKLKSPQSSFSKDTASIYTSKSASVISPSMSKPKSARSSDAQPPEDYTDELELPEKLELKSPASSSPMIKKNIVSKPPSNIPRTVINSSLKNQISEPLGDLAYVTLAESFRDVRNVLGVYQKGSEKFLQLEAEIHRVLRQTDEMTHKNEKLMLEVSTVTSRLSAAQVHLGLIQDELLEKEATDGILVLEQTNIQAQIDKIKQELAEQKKIRDGLLGNVDPGVGRLFPFVSVRFQWTFGLLLLLFIEVLTVAMMFIKYESYIEMLENSILYQTEPVQHFVDQAAGGFWAQTEKAWLTAANYF